MLPLVIIMDNLRSAYNVGSILRLSEASGVSHVIACGITPTAPHQLLEKTAKGALYCVAMEYEKETVVAVEGMKKKGYTIVALENTQNSVLYCDYNFSNNTKICLVVGSETAGVCADVLKICDVIVSIPMIGLKSSINVSTATSVCIFEILRQTGVYKIWNNK
eukprot:GHVR01095625.1.p1 GENE.GHVR01095625.1~~GHVR01095625.1.p1  ORF type:complete len:163 (+),score=35.95 GHVR01095625.1:438-926(+)